MVRYFKIFLILLYFFACRYAYVFISRLKVSPREDIRIVSDQHEIKERNEINKSKILIFTIAVGDPWFKQLVKENRKNYCQKHGYQNLFLEKFTTEIEKGLNINWSKITEGLQLFNESASYEWIFFADLDLFIMNLNITVESVIDDAISRKYPSKSKAEIDPLSSTTDLIIAHDGNGANFGSFIIRNSKFARNLFEEIWNLRRDTKVPYIDVWYENACLMHLLRINKKFNSHVAYSTQKMMNSYPSTENRGHYKYQSGDFILHFAGMNKKLMAGFIPTLLELQPELKSINFTIPPTNRITY
jgi:hypothetical protein